MKYFYLSILLFLPMLLHGQEYPKFELTMNGVEPIVVQFDGMSAPILYQKTLVWVQKTYKNPEKVLAANIPNQEVRINGFSESAFLYKTMGMTNYYDLDYTYTVQFKDEKLRLEFTPGQAWSNGSPYVSYEYFFKKTGELKNVYKDSKPSYEETMNNLVNSLCDYLNDKGKAGDW